jgi:hypothetical protein
MWRIRHINWIKNMLMNASIQHIFLSNLHGSEQLHTDERICLLAGTKHVVSESIGEEDADWKQMTEKI